MLNNKLREKVRLGSFKKKTTTKKQHRPDSDLAAAEGRQVKGRFLRPLTQEVGTVRWFEQRDSGRRSRSRERLRRHRRHKGSQPSTSTVRPRAEVHLLYVAFPTQQLQRNKVEYLTNPLMTQFYGPRKNIQIYFPPPNLVLKGNQD